jgi:hypothetical protein
LRVLVQTDMIIASFDPSDGDEVMLSVQTVIFHPFYCTVIDVIDDVHLLIAGRDDVHMLLHAREAWFVPSALPPMPVFSFTNSTGASISLGIQSYREVAGICSSKPYN